MNKFDALVKLVAAQLSRQDPVDIDDALLAAIEAVKKIEEAILQGDV